MLAKGFIDINILQMRIYYTTNCVLWQDLFARGDVDSCRTVDVFGQILYDQGVLPHFLSVRAIY